MSRKRKDTKIWHALRRFIVSAISLVAIAILINLAPNYEKSDLSGKINLIINNNNITKSLKNEILIENDKIYLSFDDTKNFFDEYLLLDGDKIIATSNTKTTSIPVNGGKVYENGSYRNIEYNIINQDNKYYLPLNILSSIYNFELNYNEDNKIITIDSLNRKLVTAISSKASNIKYKPTNLSKTVDKVERGETLYVLQNTESGKDEKEGKYLKVRTEDGVIGYIKESKLINKVAVRDDLEKEKIDGKIGLVWDYYNQYTAAPARTEQIKGADVVLPSFFELRSDGSLAVNIGNSGMNYINWTKQANLKVWPVLSNSMLK